MQYFIIMAWDFYMLKFFIAIFFQTQVELTFWKYIMLIPP